MTGRGNFSLNLKEIPNNKIIFHTFNETTKKIKIGNKYKIFIYLEKRI